MAFDWLGDATSRQQPPSLPTPISPLLGNDSAPFTRDLLPNGILGEPLTDMDMTDAFLLDAHSQWYALCFPMRPRAAARVSE